MPRSPAIVFTAVLLAANTMLAGGPALARPDAFFPAGSPATTNTDDSCDISVQPAATLLLPYFEVDIRSSQATAQTTLFTIVNVSHVPQIAHVTIWSDWAFPVTDFNIFLTGYDVQAVNLYDILARGLIAPPGGTSSATTPGPMSAANNANPNFSPTAAPSCGDLPGRIPATILTEVQAALTTGKYSACGTSKVGGPHVHAIGYVTIDVSSTCSTTLPTTPRYYTDEILFDNVLIGDYQQIDPNPDTGNYAGGNPLVHIRAIPEGGPAGSTPATNLPYTFYDRYTAKLRRRPSLGLHSTTNDSGVVPRTIDRRQPLPSAFAARDFQGGTGAFNTNYQIWREGVTGDRAACSDYIDNGDLSVIDVVRFDEHEFPEFLYCTQICIPEYYPPPTPAPRTTAAIPTSSPLFPIMYSPSGDVAGWMYLNLNDGGSAHYSSARNGFALDPSDSWPGGARQSQNWVTVSMFAEGRYAVNFDATSLGNGCSPARKASVQGKLKDPIGPAGGVPVCPPQATCTPPSSYTGSNVTP